MKILLPGKALSRHIEKYWYAETNRAGDYLVSEYYPDGNADLLFEFSSSCCRLFLFGPAAKKAFIKTRMDCSYLSIRFRPGKFPRCNDIDPASLVDRFVEVPKIFGYHVDFFGDLLHAIESPVQKLNTIEEMLSKADIQSSGQIHLDQQAVECIEKSGGTKDIGEISREMGISIRQLERRVTNLVGLSPKAFSRTVRLQRILAALSNGYPHRLTDLAYQNGYSDQSHFIRDIKVLTGSTPGCLRRAHRIDSRITYLPVVKPLEYSGALFHQI